MEISPHRHHLSAEAERFSFDLTAVPLKAPALHGDRGYSLKGGSAERASCYYSFTRLGTAGKVRVGEKMYSVTGLSWLDHEFSTAPLEPGIEGWDWFSLQLDDGTELMAFLLRLADGRLHPASSGTFVETDGSLLHLTHGDFSIRVTDRWKSRHSGAEYPAGWRLTIPQKTFEITVSPRYADQELRTPGSTGITYWEGSVSASGAAGDRPVTGTGYVELTGYAGAFDQPL